MLSERQLEALLLIFEQRMQKVVDQYLRDMGEHLKAIGQLLPSDVNRLVELKRVNANVNHIKREIGKAAGLSVQDIEKVFTAVAASDYEFMSKYYGEARQLPIRKNKSILRILQAQARVTSQELANLSQTTILSEGYRRAVDVAIQTAQAGVTDYNTAIRSALKEAAKEGLRVRYPNSGLTRRLDTAVRMNVLDGIRALNNDVLEQTGKEFGADGIELSAHALCAEDHLPYQGRQFSMEEFETIQMRLRRPIGMWNCKHTRHPIILGISESAYSPEQLERLRRNSSQEITIDGETKTRYEWTQEQRRIETAIRQQDDILTMAKAAGDSVSRIEAERNIQQLIRRYDDLSEKVGLELRYDRTVGHAVYKPNVTKSLKKPAHGDIMNLKKAGIVFPPSMDPVKYKKMCEKLLANGIQVIAAEADDLRFLEFMGAEAMALGTNVILHQRKIPSASAFFEEIIHIYQNRTLGELKENDFVERARREIEANRKLVKYAVSYGLTSADKSDIERNLRTWEEDYERRSGHKYE